MPAHRTTAGWPPARLRRRRTPSRGPQLHGLVSLVGRLLVAEAGAAAAVGVGYNRRNLPWLFAMIAVQSAAYAVPAQVRQRFVHGLRQPYRGQPGRVPQRVREFWNANFEQQMGPRADERGYRPMRGKR